MNRIAIISLMVLGTLCCSVHLANCAYHEVGLPKWQCLNCGQRMQAYTPPQYGCPKGMYNKHSWIKYR